MSLLWRVRLGTASWQDVGGTQDPNPGSSEGRIEGRFLLVNNSAFSPSRERGAWDKGGTDDNRVVGAAGKTTQLSSFAKPCPDKLARRQEGGERWPRLAVALGGRTSIMLFVLPSPLTGPSNSSLGQEVSRIFILFKNPPFPPPLGPGSVSKTR